MENTTTQTTEQQYPRILTDRQGRGLREFATVTARAAAIHKQSYAGCYYYLGDAFASVLTLMYNGDNDTVTTRNNEAYPAADSTVTLYK